MSWRLFFLGLSLGLAGCASRDDLAPVVDSAWRSQAAKAAQYQVKAGDTLYSIAFRYDRDYRDLARLNRLTSPYLLRIGQRIQLQAQSLPIARSQRSNPKPLAQRYLGGSWLWPAEGRLLASFLPHSGKKGISIAGRPGTKIRASAAGLVAYAGSGLKGYGNLIIIKHAGPYLTAYGYNRRLLVREGQQVAAGQAIAEMGQINARQAGLHFEIRKAGQPVNPLQYLQAKRW